MTRLDMISEPGSSTSFPEDAYDVALKGVLREMPYNSATEFLTRYGTDSPNPRLGAACIHQTLEVARRAELMGMSGARLLQDERHVGAVWETDDCLVVLDPYLLHREPIRFPKEEMEAGLSEVDVKAAPNRKSNSGEDFEGRVTARYKRTDGGYLIRLSYSRFSPKLDQYVLSRHFTLRSESLFDIDAFTSDMQALLTHPEQNSLSIRALTNDLSTVIEAILPLHRFGQGRFIPSDIWLRRSNGEIAANEAPGSEPLWETLEDAVDVRRDEIVDHLMSAAEIYRSLADPGTVLDEYRLEDV